VLEGPIPVVLIAGGLGSGKTTLLRQLLTAAADLGLRPALIVNEFGAVNVDGALLQGVDNVDVYELTAGCICCVGTQSLRTALFDTIVRQPDAILIETSGLADPVGTLDALTMPDLLDRVRVTGMITVADPTQELTAGRSPLTAERQFALADLVIINKVDLVAPGAVVALVTQVRAYNPGVRLIETSHCVVPAALLSPFLDGTRATTRPASGPAPDHEHPPVRTLALPLPLMLDRDRFEQWLRALPPAVLRAKGFVRFAPADRLHIFQFATGVRQITAVALEPPPDGIAILIGTALDEAGLRGDLAACATASAEVVVEG
jgi:G3E family GTPase